MALETLFALYSRLDKEELRTLNEKRASVAVIFRVIAVDKKNKGQGEEDEIKDLSDLKLLEKGFSQTKNGTLQILFIKRAQQPKDIHSGQIAFPGGKLDPGESSKQAAIRETFEEVGLDLTNSFIYLGKTSERNVYQHFRKKVLYVCCHRIPYLVFLQLEPTDLKMNLNPDEVEKAFWVDFSVFTHNLSSTFIVRVKEQNGLQAASFPFLSIFRENWVRQT